MGCRRVSLYQEPSRGNTSKTIGFSIPEYRIIQRRTDRTCPQSSLFPEQIQTGLPIFGLKIFMQMFFHFQSHAKLWSGAGSATTSIARSVTTISAPATA